MMEETEAGQGLQPGAWSLAPDRRFILRARIDASENKHE
jgi:hypothetical protein